MKITREQLKGSYSEGEALAIYRQVREDGDFLAFLYQFMQDDDHQVTRNALWGLTKANQAEIKQLQVALNSLIDLAISTNNPSVRRLSLNLIERLYLKEDDIRTDFLDFCLEHMAMPQEFPVIQSLCMKLAYRMCSFFPELKEELIRTLEVMEMEYYKPAVKSVRNRILSGKTKTIDQR